MAPSNEKQKAMDGNWRRGSALSSEDEQTCWRKRGSVPTPSPSPPPSRAHSAMNWRSKPMSFPPSPPPSPAQSRASTASWRGTSPPSPPASPQPLTRTPQPGEIWFLPEAGRIPEASVLENCGICRHPIVITSVDMTANNVKFMWVTSFSETDKQLTELPPQRQKWHWGISATSQAHPLQLPTLRTTGDSFRRTSWLRVDQEYTAEITTIKETDLGYIRLDAASLSMLRDHAAVLRDRNSGFWRR